MFDNEDMLLGLEGDFQKHNASLAIATTVSHLRTLGTMDDVPALKQLSTSSTLLQHGITPQIY